jgi:hypothetical protein
MSFIKPGQMAKSRSCPWLVTHSQEPGILEALVAATDRFALQPDLTPRVTAGK